MSSNSREQSSLSTMEVIVDPRSNKRYQKGRFLGKGGFAKCYELTDEANQRIYAGKIVSKTLLVKDHQKAKMTQEISIHKSLKHKHIVGFHSYFEDSSNVYIVLELCRKRSLMELHKRRKAVTEYEARYFMQQLLLGVKYLHDQNVIHRDLKLGNLFINDDMELKIGDFGLATRLEHEGERKKTVCGTPNYIAPEVLCRGGHSFEVDVWSIGVILYTLLVGKPPFETQTLQDTYKKIKKNEYSIPHRVNTMARSLIQRLLHATPDRRPTVDQILVDDFMTKGYMPIRLPTSCLTTAPRFDAHAHPTGIYRKPLLEINSAGSGTQRPVQPPTKKPDPADPADPPKTDDVIDRRPSDPSASQDLSAHYLKELLTQVSNLLASNPGQKPKIEQDEAEDPACVPMLWVSKWVDYSDKYGLGYQLSDDSIGVFFNDFSKLLLLADGLNIHYIERNGTEHYHSMKKYPKELSKKVTLLSYFKSYMNEHLLKAGAAMTPREGDELIRIPSLKVYFRTRSAIVLQLTNGTFQINFFDDHTKIILCPLMAAVTYIDKKKNFRTYKISLLQQHGCCEDLLKRLRYAKTMIEKMTSMKSGYSSASRSDGQGSRATAIST